MTDVFIKKENLGTDTHTIGMPYEYEGRGKGDVLAANEYQRMSAIHQKTGKFFGTVFPSQSLKRVKLADTSCLSVKPLSLYYFVMAAPAN